MESASAFGLEFRLRTARLSGGVALVSLSGDLDLATVPELVQALADPARRASHTLIVDLTETTFLDSAALGALVAEAKTRRGDGMSLLVVCDDRSTLRALEITGLRSLLHVEPTLRSALPQALGLRAAAEPSR